MNCEHGIPSFRSKSITFYESLQGTCSQTRFMTLLGFCAKLPMLYSDRVYYSLIIMAVDINNKIMYCLLFWISNVTYLNGI